MYLYTLFSEVVAVREGVFHRSATTMGKFQDLTGQKFGRLTVIKRIENKRIGSRQIVQYACLCECGQEVKVTADHLRNGDTKSCGCLQKELAKKRVQSHGQSNSRLYTIWSLMKARCLNSKNTGYVNYGGRGIRICKRWLNFESFYIWAISHGYNKNLSIDRIDNNGDYKPSNCRWTDMKTQCNNRRTSIIIEFENEKHTMKKWAEIKNIKYRTLARRFEKGWTIEDALTKPIKQHKEYKNTNTKNLNARTNKRETKTI